MTDRPGPPNDVGSLSEEAEKLIAVVQDWARRSTEDRPIATGAPECQWCPICQLISVLRGDRPDVAERAGEVARKAVTALVAAFAASHSAHSADSCEPTGSAPGASTRRVQRIDLSTPSVDAER